MNPHIIQAKRNIYREGINVTFITVTEGTYNSDTGTVTNTETETIVKGYPKRVTANTYNYPNLIGKEATEWLVVASDLPGKPNPQDKMKRGSTVFTVDSVKEIIAMGEPVIYKVLVVKG
jgi:hypothetical protein